jgi:hypothetical protein
VVSTDDMCTDSMQPERRCVMSRHDETWGAMYTWHECTRAMPAWDVPARAVPYGEMPAAFSSRSVSGQRQAAKREYRGSQRKEQFACHFWLPVLEPTPHYMFRYARLFCIEPSQLGLARIMHF